MELVIIAAPSDLHGAINQAEKIEMACNFAASGQIDQCQSNVGRGKGNAYCGRGRFNAMQTMNTGQSTMQGQQVQAVVTILGLATSVCMYQ